MLEQPRKRGWHGQSQGEDALGGPGAVMWMEARSGLTPGFEAWIQPCVEHA